MSVLTCPICRRHGWITRDGLADHLTREHSPAVVAETLADLSTKRARCTKLAYATEAEARDALLSTRLARDLRGRQRRKECRTYQCPACGHWHLTSTAGASA